VKEACCAIEADRAGHVVGDQADRADALDHWRTLMSLGIPDLFGLAHHFLERT
jgi:hypothetical protein